MSNLIEQFKNDCNTQADSRRTLVSVRVDRKLIQKLDKQKDNRSEAIRDALKQEYGDRSE